MPMTLEQALARFGVVTVMEPYFFEVGSTITYTDGVPNNALFSLDSLRISNFTQEGPTKTAKGGLNAETIFRHGKTARLEMEDVIGRIDALKRLMGLTVTAASTTANTSVTEVYIPVSGSNEILLGHTPENPLSPALVVRKNGVLMTVTTDYTHSAGSRVVDLVAPANGTDEYSVVYQYEASVPDTIAVTEKFGAMLSIWGRTFVIDQATGTRQYINIWIPKFLPDGLFNMTMEAEGDFGVISVAGDLYTDDCGVFYEFTKGTQPAACL